MTVVKAYYKHEHGETPLRLQTPEDVDRLVGGLLTEDYSHSVAALYVEGRLNEAGVPDHELLVAINNEDGDVGALRYMGGWGHLLQPRPGRRGHRGHLLHRQRPRICR